MATILDIRRSELADAIERLREQRARIDEKLDKLERELESLKDFVPATDAE
jgi:predicted nuclease with TOPRIM domain